jgi:uncharacterized membrane protein HdeD (DUF308 family)
MIIFRSTQENKISNYLKAALYVAFGVYLIVAKVNAMELIVQIIAGGALIMGVVSFLIGLRFTSLQMLSSSAIFSVLLSLLLFAFAGPISAIIRYILGVILLLSGGSQTFSIMSGQGNYRFGAVSYLLPIIMVLGGCMFFSEELIGNDIMGLMAGVAFIMFGLTKIMRALKLNKKRPASRQTYSQQEKPQAGGWTKFDDSTIKDVDYEKVDEQ